MKSKNSKNIRNNPLKRIHPTLSCLTSFSDFGYRHNLRIENNHEILLESYVRMQVIETTEYKPVWCRSLLQVVNEIGEEFEASRKNLTNDEKTRLKLVVYFLVPQKNYVVFSFNKSTVHVKKAKNQGEQFVMVLKNLELENLSFLSGKRMSDFGIHIAEKVLVIQFLNQSFFSKWKFYFKNVLSESKHRSKSFEPIKSLKIDDIQVFLPSSIRPKSSSMSSIANKSLVDWTTFDYSNWSREEVMFWLKCIYYTSDVTYYKILSKEFTKVGVSGTELSGIENCSDLKQFKSLKSTIVRHRFFEEMLVLRNNNGKFHKIRYMVIRKYVVNKKYPYIRDVDDNFPYSYDKDKLVDRITRLLFNLREDDDAEKIINELIKSPKIDFFKFSIKVVAIVLKDNLSYFDKFTYGIVKPYIETFYHLGLLIKNVQLDWCANEIVRVSKTSSSKPILCVDVDCVCVKKENIMNWIDKLSREIIKWNIEMRYAPITIKKTGTKANCQDFVNRMMNVLNEDWFGFPRLVTSFFNRMKTERPLKVFFFSNKFRKKFKLGSEIRFLHDKTAKEVIVDISRNYIIFHSHSMIDQFLNILRRERFMLIDFYEEYEMLKAFDRAFHVAHFFALKRKNFHGFKRIFAISKQHHLGCPFNKTFREDEKDFFEEVLENAEIRTIQHKTEDKSKCNVM